MAETLLEYQNAAFWLPSSFLTDDDDEQNDEFLNSSVIGSEVGDEFVSELTRHLANSSIHNSITQKPLNLSTSPQSTLTGFGPWKTRSGLSSNGSPNGPSSPPLTPPFENDVAWKLLHEAAGQIARLKVNALANQINHHKNRGLLSTPRNVSFSSKPLNYQHHSSFYDFPRYEQGKRQGNGNLYCPCHNHSHNQRSCNNGGPSLGLPNSTWPPLRPNNHHHHGPNGMRSAFHNGLGPGPIKRQSTGTGVFLPRRVGDTTTIATHKIQQHAHELGKRTSGCTPMWLGARAADALDMEFEEVKDGVNVNQRNRFGSGLLLDQEIIMARRNVVMEHQRRSLMRNDEIRLPSDWTY